MVRRVDTMADIRAKARRMRWELHGPHLLLGPEPRWGGRIPEPIASDETPRESVALKLQRARRFPGRVAHWLFIKGGMAPVLILGLMAAGLVGLFQPGR